MKPGSEGARETELACGLPFGVAPHDHENPGSVNPTTQRGKYLCLIKSVEQPGHWQHSPDAVLGDMQTTGRNADMHEALALGAGYA